MPSLVTACRQDGPVREPLNRQGSVQPVAAREIVATTIAERMQVQSAMPQR